MNSIFCSYSIQGRFVGADNKISCYFRRDYASRLGYFSSLLFVFLPSLVDSVPMFMSRAPELFEVPSNCTITAKTDIWSLGCSLYAAAFGKSPCDGTSLGANSGHIVFPRSQLVQSKYSYSIVFFVGFLLFFFPVNISEDVAYVYKVVCDTIKLHLKSMCHCNDSLTPLLTL